MECEGPGVARNVAVLLDGVPAADHPTVYVASDATDIMTPGSELDYLFVLTAGHPQFETVEIRWTDAHDRRQEFVREVREAAQALA